MRTQTLILLDRYAGGLLLLLMKPVVIAAGWVFRRDHDLPPRGDILVLKFLGAGSLFIALPDLVALRQRYPDKRLHLFTTSSIAGFMEPLGIFDVIHVLNIRSPLTALKTAILAMWRLRHIDTVIDLEIYSRAATLMAVFLRARNRLAFFIDEPFWKEKIATHLLFFSRTAGVYDYYDQLFELLDVKPVSMTVVHEWMSKVVKPSSSGREGRHICLGHACSGTALERQLSPALWGRVLAEHFSTAEPTTFEILGSVSDQVFGEQVAEAIRQALPRACVINACGRYTPREVIATLAGADAFWGIDSLLLHIALCLGKPTTSFWGPTTPHYYMREIRPDMDRVHYDPIICSPCVHTLMSAPCKGQNICIQRAAGIDPASLPKPRWVLS